MKLAVYCGSSIGASPVYADAAEALGRSLVERGISLVYGGGNVGLMGRVADAVLAAGGEAIGVMPKHLVDREIAHTGLSQLEVVADMSTRKARMAELADGFIALPGGAGTLEEIAEQWTWAQLGLHKKPIAFYNVAGYYDAMVSFADTMLREGFMKPEYRDMLIFSDTIGDILSRIDFYQAPGEKWR